MTYDKPLPHVRDLLKLTKLADSFPLTRQQLAETAKKWSLPNEVTDFLQLFPADEVFESRADFATRSEELEMLIYQERESPQEISRSPQG